MGAVSYKRIRHAVHYAYQHSKRGHDLEEWTYQQDARLPKPDGIPSNASYHSGFVKDGRQHWVYTRTAPLSEGTCANCAPIDLVGMAKTILGVA